MTLTVFVVAKDQDEGHSEPLGAYSTRKRAEKAIHARTGLIARQTCFDIYAIKIDRPLSP